MERLQSSKGLAEALRQCEEVIGRFEGSEETLRHIRQVEQSLKVLTAFAN